MGAANFYCTSTGSNAQEAFTSAVKKAQWDFGHGGYTGTIAEKSNFTMASENPLLPEAANHLVNSLTDTKYSSKWGPAGCVELMSSVTYLETDSTIQKSKTKRFIFFGWASS